MKRILHAKIGTPTFVVLCIALLLISVIVTDSIANNVVRSRAENNDPVALPRVATANASGIPIADGYRKGFYQIRPYKSTVQAEK